MIADDARLAAQVSCALASPGAYLPIVDGPRLQRPDRDAEIIRRNNGAARANATQIVLAGLADESSTALSQAIGVTTIKRVSSAADIDRFLPRVFKGEPLLWGRDRIGIGLLRALRAQKSVIFEDAASPTEHVPSKSGHLVVCEEGNDLSQVIAANYAFALNAGLCLIPEVTENQSRQILEYFYNLYEERRISQTAALEGLKEQLRWLCGPLSIPDGGSLTFITGELPYGFGFSEVPSTHLFKYPDLGISIINGLAAEQPGSRGAGVAVLVDPETTEAPEIAAAENLLPGRSMFVRGYKGGAADVRSITDMIELFPYDLLIIATHCGDAPGFRWTYEFIDSEGLSRTLVVDIAVGFARTDQADLLNVTQYERFISLDGVDWFDPDKENRVHIGTAISDYVERTRVGRDDELKPVKKENIPRVIGSAALRMSDHNYIALPRPLADMGTPIVVNNACASWHNLAETFTFGNARAYIGTLHMVTTSEAHGVVVKLLDKHFGKMLPAALWSAQREVYGDSVRRPYIITGVYPQRLQVARRDTLERIRRRLARGVDRWKAQLHKVDPNDNRKVMPLKERVEFYERELAAFEARWFRHSILQCQTPAAASPSPTARSRCPPTARTG